MQPENFNKWQVNDLKNYLLQYNIDPDDIKGSGKNGNVIKVDLVKTAKKIKSKIYINSNVNQNNDLPDKSGYTVPEDIIKEILNVSDVNTIINLCGTSTMYQRYCNDQFWKNIANREEMPIKTTAKEWIEEYLYHQYEVNVLIQMLADGMTIVINLATPVLIFDDVNYLNVIGDDYLINNIIISKEKLYKSLMQLFYEFPKTTPSSMYVSLRKKNMAFFLAHPESIKGKTKSVQYKNAIKLWNKYYK